MSKPGNPPPRRAEKPALGEGRLDEAGPGKITEKVQDSRRRRDRLLAGAFTALAHVAILAALLWPRAANPPSQPEPAPLMLSLVESPKPQPPGPPDAPPADTPQDAVQPVVPRAAPPVITITKPVADNSDVLSEAQLAGAASADDGGGGGGGGGCNTARFVQQALRRDPLVHAAVADANRLGKSVMLWNGDWVQSGGQDGKGLSAVREAILWELAFAPQACRDQPVHGMVLLSLADGRTRFAIGAGNWRWSDLLGLRGRAMTQ